MGIDRSTWLISGIVFAAIGFTGSMVLFTTVGENASWESDIAFGLLVVGFVGLILGVLAIMGWGLFGHVRVTAGSVGTGENHGGGESGEGRASSGGGRGKRTADEGHDPT
jgi:hypothetical protein